MRVVFAFIAEAATFNPEGKFNALGGDVTALHFPRFPYRQTMLALVMKLEFTEEEANRHYNFRTELLDDNGTPMTEGVEQIFQPRPSALEGTLPVEGFVVSFPALLFERPGIYTFHAGIDGDVFVELPLRVLLDTGNDEQT